MGEVTVILPDGSEQSYPAGVTPAEIANAISPRLAKEAVVAEVDGKLIDLARPLPEGRHRLRLLTADTAEGLDTLRHSTAHLMAQALKRLYPGTKLAIGPTIQNGFYYDVECPVQITPEDLPKIEEEMRKIQQENLRIEREAMSKADAEKFFAELDEKFKRELIEGL